MASAGDASSSSAQATPEAVRPNYLYTAPFIPLILLILPFFETFSTFKLSVSAAMLIGSIYAPVHHIN